ncbi:MAG: amidohydrolase family protein [Caulobacteraceae bacterium]
MKLFLTLACLIAGASIAGAVRAAPGATAFVDVTVIPMDRPGMMTHQTVLVRDARIAAIGRTGAVRIPRSARVIKGRGRWLIPGLADMHTHIDDPRDFPLLLANGVTTTLNMGGASENYRTTIRARLRRGEMLGPYPLMAKKFDGPGDPGGKSVVPNTTDEARAEVRRARSEGFDYIKLYARLTPDIFEAITDEAARQHIAVIGHAVRSVGLKAGIEHGQIMIAHAEEYLTVFDDDSVPDYGRIPELVRMTASHNVTVTANIFGIAKIAEQWGKPDQVSAYLGDPRFQFLRPDLREKWRKASYARLPDTYSAQARFTEKLTAVLHDAHVPIIVGTDAPDIPGVAPGYSVIDEIDALKAVGFSNYDALAAATSVSGDFVARTVPGAERFGVVKAGARADLVLLDQNPLMNLNALKTPAGVMVQGAWLPAAKLREMVKAAAHQR